MFLKYSFGSQGSPAQSHLHKSTTEVQHWHEKRIWKIKCCHEIELLPSFRFGATLKPFSSLISWIFKIIWNPNLLVMRHFLSLSPYIYVSINITLKSVSSCSSFNRTCWLSLKFNIMIFRIFFLIHYLEATNQEFLIHIRNMPCSSEVFNQQCLGNIATPLFEAVTGYLGYILNKRIRATHSCLNPPCTLPGRPAWLYGAAPCRDTTGIPCTLQPCLYDNGAYGLLGLSRDWAKCCSDMAILPSGLELDELGLRMVSAHLLPHNTFMEEQQLQMCMAGLFVLENRQEKKALDL